MSRCLNESASSTSAQDSSLSSWLLAGVIAVVGLIGYAFYADRKRRSAPDYKEKIRERRIAKEASFYPFALFPGYRAIEIVDEDKSVEQPIALKTSEPSLELQVEHKEVVPLPIPIDIQVNASGSVFCKEEMKVLYGKAVKYAGHSMHQFWFLYRCKPKHYFTEIDNLGGRMMKPYLKDKNGHAASPINGAIKGLFFHARLFDEQLPSTSPFGNIRMQIPAGKLINDSVNLYFADFYCNQSFRGFSSVHYITVVICTKGSNTDLYCANHLIPLSVTNNTFLSLKNGSCYVNDSSVWIEIYYTEEISLFDAKFEEIETFGLGHSRKDGVPHNKKCLQCNLYPERNEFV